MTIAELKSILATYSEDMQVYIFVEEFETNAPIVEVRLSADATTKEEVVVLL